MTWVKGKSGNPKGRPAGTKNKVTTDIKGTIALFLEKNIGSLQTTYNEMEAKDKLLFIERLLKYVIPQQTQNKIDINAMSEQEIDRLADQLIEKLDNE